MKPVAAFCLSLLLLSGSISCYGQGENNIWCFGVGVGLDFNTPIPTLTTNNINTEEGSGAVSDANGSLLFYACPTTVWDRNNNVMPNGSGILGNVSSTQGVAIVRSFTNMNQYYLFTMGSVEQVWANQQVYLAYSVIDMTLNNGLGDVVTGQKNIIIDSEMIEKMAVVKGAGCFYWLLVHHRSAPLFHSFKIDASGVNTNPVISISGVANINNAYTTGEMKVSPNDSLVVLVNVNHPINEIHSFNNATGTVYNGQIFDSTQWGQYGVSFSPDGSKLYMAVYNGAPLYQYDMSLFPNIQAIRNSKDSIANYGTTGMRIGPDHKIYVNTLNHISIINNPNVAGAGCNFVYNAIPVGALDIGLNFGNSITIVNIDTVINGLTDTNMCFAQGPITINAPSGYNYYLWSDDSDQQGDTFTHTSIKWVYSQIGCHTSIDTFKIISTLDTVANVKDTNACFVNNIPIIAAPGGYNTYMWSDGFAQQQDTFGSPGTKWVYAQNGCDLLIDTFKVHAYIDTTIGTVDTSHCVAYSPITIYAPGGYTSYTWSDGKTTQVDTFFNTTTKWVTAQNGCELLIDTVHFTATTIPPDSIAKHGGDTLLCFDNLASVNVSAPSGYTYYLWNDGTPTQVNSFAGPGTKWVYAQKLCYLEIDTFNVSAMPTDTTDSRTDTMICFSEQATLSAMQGYGSYLWSDGNTGMSDTFSNNSTKLVYAHRACEERIDTIAVQFINDLVVDLGPDTAVCKGQYLDLDATSVYNTAQYLWQDGKTDPAYHVTNGGDYSVTVSVGPCSVSDTVRVHEKVIDIKLGKGLIPCHEESIVLDAGVDSAGYLWQDGSTGRTIKATKEATYSVKVTQGECSATASVDVKFEGCPCNVVLPTAFSPNNDGKNDKFGATLSCDINSYRLMIYNRWGNRVFYSEDINEKWDGTCKGIALDGDVFNYYLEFKDGENKVYYYKGTVTLVR
jgi:gliding motility-associated-like protein